MKGEARGLTKQSLRADTIGRFQLSRAKDLDEFVGQISSGNVQASIKGYLKNLKSQHRYL